jgi:peptidyl-prolyl cis-trans isomerase SurA
MRNIILIALFILVWSSVANAQKVLDEVVAQVGNEMILLSDVESQLLQYKDLPAAKIAQARCIVLDQLMQKKLLLTRAKIDSIKIHDEQVENEINRRMAYFVQTYGSEEAIEKFYHKSILEIKNDFRDAIKDQLLEEQEQNKVVSDVDPTPEEVKKFYTSIPKDSLPYYNTEFEIGQIIIFPKASKADRERIHDKLLKMRNEIINGRKSFCFYAIAYSEDGTAKNCGDLGMQRADNFVPEFAAAALMLRKDSISNIVETKFGYHIIQMIERKGDEIHVRHILLHISTGSGAVEDSKRFLDSIRTAIPNGPKDSLFTTFAYKYSQDNDTKNRGGMMIDQKTSSSHIPVDELDAVTFSIIDKLKTGEISQPVYYKSPEGKEGYRILYLKSKNAPHRANLKDDYPRIKQLAQDDKKAQKLDTWFNKYIPATYIKINPGYNSCQTLDKWRKGAVSSLEK